MGLALNIFKGSNTKDLLRKCSWLSIKQLIWYHSLILLWKIVNTDKIPHFKNQISSDRCRAQNLRRLEPKGNLYLNSNPSTIRVKNSFIHRSVVMWNSLPTEMKLINSYPTFKSKTKEWILINIEVHGDVIP